MIQPEISSKRLFLGVSVSAEIKKARRELVEQVGNVSGVKWVPEENLHMTVLFIGAVPELMIENLISLIRLSTSEVRSFALEEVKWKLAPPGKPPRMIWLQFPRHDRFSKLVSLMRERIGSVISLPQQHQTPIPHVTIARMTPQSNIPSGFLQFRNPDGIYEVNKLILWESVLSANGAQYLPLAEFRLS